MDCTSHVAKTKALISFAVTAPLICVFVFAYAKSRFSHDPAHMYPRHVSLDYFPVEDLVNMLLLVTEYSLLLTLIRQ